MAIMGESSLLTEKVEKPTIKDLFKNRTFMIIFAAQITFLLAGTFAYMTFNYLVFDITKNASLMGLMGVIAVLSTIIVVNLAGVIVDRYNQKKIIFISTIVRAIALIGFLICYLLKDNLINFSLYSITTNNGNFIIIGSPNYNNFISLMYILYFFANGASTFLNIAVNAYSKYIIEKKNLLIANSFNSSINQIASVVAPVIVGVLITLSYLYSFSVGVVLDIIVTIICYFLIVYGKNPPKEETKKSNKIKDVIGNTFKDIKEGFIATKAEPKIWFALIVYTVANFGFAIINGLYTVVVQGEMKLNPTWIGAISTVMSTVAILTALIILKIGKINRKLILVLLVIFIESLGLFIFAFNRNPWVMIFACTIPFGFVNGAANIPTNTLRQEKLKYNQQGRVFSNAIVFTSTASLLGFLVVTFTANYLKTTYFLLIDAILFAILSLVSIIVFLTKRSLHNSDYEEKIIYDNEKSVRHIDQKSLKISKKVVQP